MNVLLSLKANEKLVLKDPEGSVLGKSIVKGGLELMEQIGYEAFTFRKLAEHIGTTEASIYRYFENKHRLLLYLLTWYWNGLEFAIESANRNIDNPRKCAMNAIHILCLGLPDWLDMQNLDKKKLYALAVAESSKAYLIKDVDAVNSYQLFSPYKSNAHVLALIFQQINPKFPYAHSLATTVIESAHNQHFFADHLPSLTDFGGKNHQKELIEFIETLVFSVLKG